MVKIFSYKVRKSKKARNILLHVDMDGSVELVVPWRVSYREGRRFLKKRGQWVDRQLMAQRKRAAAMPKRSFESGAAWPAFGQEIRLEVIRENRKRAFVSFTDGVLQIRCGIGHDVAKLLERWYRKEAQARYEQQARDLADACDLSISKVRINGAKTQWGSCNHKRAVITLNWKLALAPKEAADYVIAHEVAHLKFANHSKQYWQFVASIYPGYEQQKRWLRINGYTLTI